MVPNYKLFIDHYVVLYSQPRRGKSTISKNVLSTRMKVSWFLLWGPSESPAGPRTLVCGLAALLQPAGDRRNRLGRQPQHSGVDERHIAPGWAEGGEICGCEQSSSHLRTSSTPVRSDKWTASVPLVLTASHSTASFKRCLKTHFGPLFSAHFSPLCTKEANLATGVSGITVRMCLAAAQGSSRTKDSVITAKIWTPRARNIKSFKDVCCCETFFLRQRRS